MFKSIMLSTIVFQVEGKNRFSRNMKDNTLLFYNPCQRTNNLENKNGKSTLFGCPETWVPSES